MAKALPSDKAKLFDSKFDHPWLPQIGPIPDEWEENQADWHQTAGLIAMLSHFLNTDGTQQPGLLLADEVGVGKTLQAILLIAAITHGIDFAIAGNLSAIPIMSEHSLSLSFDCTVQLALTIHIILPTL